MERQTAEKISKLYRLLSDRIEKDYGVKVALTLTYTPRGFTAKLKGADVELTSGGEITKLALFYCQSHNLNPNKPNTEGARIVGYNSDARKYPWIVEFPNGSRRRGSLSYAKHHFSNETPVPAGLAQTSQKFGTPGYADAASF